MNNSSDVVANSRFTQVLDYEFIFTVETIDPLGQQHQVLVNSLVLEGFSNVLIQPCNETDDAPFGKMNMLLKVQALVYKSDWGEQWPTQTPSLANIEKHIDNSYRLEAIRSVTDPNELYDPASPTINNNTRSARIGEDESS